MKQTGFSNKIMRDQANLRAKSRLNIEATSLYALNFCINASETSKLA